MSDDANEETQIDPKVARLVTVLNNLPGIVTNSSCGGHDNPTNPSQVASNEWYVDFELIPHQLAWESLGLIAQSATEFGDEVELTVWHDGGVRFDLRGIDVTADEFADFIEQGERGISSISNEGNEPT